MNLRIVGTVALLSAMVLQGCKLGYNRSKRPPSNSQKPPECAQPSSNVNLSSQAQEVHKLLTNLTCYSEVHNGNLIGQTLGNGDRIASNTDPWGYAELVDTLTDDHSHTPVIIDTNYEGDRQYGIDELYEANTVLKDHWSKGGLVSVSWTPFNPWTSGEDASPAYTDDVNLAALIDSDSAAFTTWREQLDHVAEALKDLNEANVAVLWRPLPEMNETQYWWGVNASATNDEESPAGPFVDLWQDMHDYLTDHHELNNLLWVYSPLDHDSTTSEDAQNAVWAYPGEEIVDVVAPIVRVDSLQISEYDELLELGRPLGLSSWGPAPNGSASRDNTFDSTLYSDRLLQRFPFVSYWLTPFSYGEPPNRSHLSLRDLKNINSLFKEGNVFSLEEAIDYELLSTRNVSNSP